MKNVMLITEMYMLCKAASLHKHICVLHIQMLLIKEFIYDKYVLIKSWSCIFFSTLCSHQKYFYVFNSFDDKAEFFSSHSSLQCHIIQKSF